MPRGGAEAAGERAGAHRGLLREALDREVLVEVLDRPVEDLGEGVAVGAARHRCVGELRLAAVALGRHHHPPGRAHSATSAPWSSRTTCRHRSMPAAVPAEVMT